MNSIRDIRHVEIGILVLLLIKVEAEVSQYVKDTRPNHLRHAFSFVIIFKQIASII